MAHRIRLWIASLFPSGRIARQIITLVSGTAAAQAIAICSMPLITRLYTPAELGVLSLFSTFFAFWSATLSLRYEYALLIADDEAEAYVVLTLAVCAVVCLSALGVPALFALQNENILGFGLLPIWAPWVIGPTFLGYGVFMTHRSWGLRSGQVRAITHATVVRSAANAGTQIVFGVFGFGIVGLFGAQLLRAWAGMAWLAYSLSSSLKRPRHYHVRGRELLVVAHKFRKYLVFEVPSSWIDQLALMLPVPMLASLHGATAAGWFGLAQLVSGIPNTQIGGAVADVFQVEVANAVVAGNAVEGRTLFYRLLRKLAINGLVPYVAVALLAPWVVPWVFGPEWRETGWTAVIMAPSLYLALLVSPLSRVLSVLQAQEYKLIYDFVAVLFLLLAYFLAMLRGYTYLEFVVAICIATALSSIVYLGVLVVVVERRLTRVSLNVHSE